MGPRGGAPYRTPEDGFFEGVVAYVGEALLRVAGGCWEWGNPTAEEPGQPVIRPDQRLDLSAISPRTLLLEVIRGKNAFVQAHADLQARVDARRGDDPAWQPVKQPTPGLDRVDPEPSYQLSAWLAERERASSTWVADYASGDTYAYSPESLPALEVLFRRLVPTKQHLVDPANGDFVDGAVWYLGEVMRKAKGGNWYYRPGAPDPWNPYIGRYYVQQPGNGQAKVPILDFEFMLGLRDTGYLAQRYAAFVK